jgi:hypothetical protein
MERGVGIFIKAAVGDEELSVFGFEGTFLCLLLRSQGKGMLFLENTRLDFQKRGEYWHWTYRYITMLETH